MITDAVECTIERRLLVNFRIDPDVLNQQLPDPFRPQLISGWALGGICFLRLGTIRPPHVPSFLGLTTENVAHRFAIEWDDEKGTHVGVYVPQRYTDSRISSWAGGKVFPGKYGLTRFKVHEGESDTRIAVTSQDGTLRVGVTARSTEQMGGELFESVDEALNVFRNGSLSYSPSENSGCLDGVSLHCNHWEAKPVQIEDVTSTIFDNQDLFPPGTCELDSGLIMRDLPARFVSNGVLLDHSPVGVG